MMVGIRKKINRFLAMIMAVVFFASCVLVYTEVKASDTEGTCGDNIAWIYDEDTGVLTLSGYGSMTDYGTTKSSGSPWYEFKTSVTEVIIECTDDDEGFVIGENAFYKCTSLTTVTISGNVTSFENGAFYNCTALTTLLWEGSSATSGIVIDPCVTYMALQTFYGCSSIESIIFEGSYVEFEESTKKKQSQFYGCTSLSYIELPSEITIIPAYMFYGCTSLENISIPDAVTEIGTFAFSATGLTSVTLSKYISILGSYVFYDCASLASVTFEDGIGVTEILDYTFALCPSLTEITLPDGVVTVGTYVFKDDTALTSVTFGTGLESIGYRTLSGCSNTSLVLHFTGEYTNDDADLAIDEQAFYGITAVAYYPSDSGTWSSSEAVQSNMQYGATSLTWAAEGEEVVSSEWYKVVYDEGTNEAVLYIFRDGDMPNFSSGTAPWYSYRGVITEIVFGVNPDDTDAEYTVTSIGDYSFYKFTALESVEIPASVTSIGKYAFSGCVGTTMTQVEDGDYMVLSGDGSVTGLNTVTFEEGSVITQIGECAFKDCSFLYSITFPETLTTIGDYAFSGCGTCATIVSYSYVLGSEDTTNASVALELLMGTYGDTAVVEEITIGDITVDEEYYTYSYRAGNNWTYSYVYIDAAFLDTLEEGSYSGCIRYENFTLPFVLTVYAAGTSDDNISSDQTTIYYGLSSIDFSHVETIGAFAFYECIYLSDVTFGDSLTFIGSKAFAYCEKLESIALPESLETIDTYAFAFSALAEVKISSYAAVGTGAFVSCTALESVTFASSGTTTGTVTLGNLVFSACTALTTITLPYEITSLSDSLFYACTALTTVAYEGTVTSIGESTFEDCTALIDAGNFSGVTSIGDRAFYNCSALAKVDFPVTLENDDVGDFVFYKCAGLADENGFVVINGVMYSYVFSVLGIDVQDYTQYDDGTSDDEDETIVNYVISTVTVPETITEFANYAFYQIFSAPNGPDADTAVSTVTLEGLRFTGSAEDVEFEEYALAGICLTESAYVYIYYSCRYADSWEAQLEDIGYSGVGETPGNYRYSTLWSVAAVSEHGIGSDGVAWSWSEDCSSAAALFICTYCGEEEEVDADVTMVRDCSTGLETYIAEVEYGGETYTDIQEIETNAGHLYEEGGWEWSEDYSSATLTLTCSACGETAILTGDAEKTSELDGRYYYQVAVTDENGNSYYDGIWVSDNVEDLTLFSTNAGVDVDGSISVAVTLNSTFEYDGELHTLMAWSGGSITAVSSDETVAAVETDGMDVIIYGITAGTAEVYVYAGDELVGIITVTSDYGDHEHIYVLITATAATCTEDSYYLWQCTYCGEYYEETGENGTATGHSYVASERVDATCTEDGYIIYICENDNSHVYIETIPAAGHKYTYTGAVEATCTEGAAMVYTCSVCGETYKVEYSEAAGHTWESEVTVLASAYSDGTVTYTCSECGETYSETFAMDCEITSSAAYYIHGSSDVSTAVITTSKTLDCFSTVTVDGMEIDPSTAYSASEGSTVITFTEAYLEYLSAGEYEVILYYDDCYIATTLTVYELSNGSSYESLNGTSYESFGTDTGDDSNIFFWGIILAAAACMMTCTAGFYFRKRKKED